MNSSVSSALLRVADTVSRLLHLLLTAPLAYAGLLPLPHPLAPSEANHIVVTGASTGIGRDAARALQRAGFSVWAGVRSQADADSVRADGVMPLIIDVADDASVDRAFEQVTAALARKPGSALVAVVANAGIGGILGPVESVPLNDVKRLFEVNVFGALRTVNKFLPLIREAKGRIVLVGSGAGLDTIPGMVPYSMTKHAIESLADGLRGELALLGVSVSLIQPGPVRTPIMEKMLTAKLDVDKETRAVYASTWKFTDEQFAIASAAAAPVSCTSDAITHAITAKFPLYRYHVTWPIYFLAAFVTKLPTQIEDAVLYLMMSAAAKRA